MTKKPLKNVFSQLFDIRPLTPEGFLNSEKIFKIRPVINFTHLIEDYERSFTPRRLKLSVKDQRTKEIFKRYLNIKKPMIKKTEEKEVAGNLIEAVHYPEIIFKYRPQLVSNVQALPRRDELLKQLENACRGGLVSDLPLLPEEEKTISKSGVVELDAKPNFWSVGKHFFDGKNRFGLTKRHFSMLLFLALLIVLAVPALNFIEKKIGAPFDFTDSLKARENIIKSRDLLAMIDFYQETKSFEDIEKGFIVAKQKTNKISSALVGILENLPKTETATASSLMNLVRFFNKASENFASAINFYSGRNFFSFLTKNENNEETLAALLDKSNRDFEEILSLLTDIQTEIEKSKYFGFPPDASEEILKLKDKTKELSIFVQGSLESNRFLSNLLGRERPKNILFVIQEPLIPQASGGLVSGWVAARAEKGVLSDFYAQGPYDLNMKLRERVIPPRPLQHMDIAWGATGANWFFDFNVSAKKISWFFEKTGGFTPDYVIAVSARFFEDLLKITGTVNLPDSKKTVSADNFRDIINGLTRPGDSSGYFPKIIAEFFPKFLEELAALEVKTSSRILDLINKNLEEKNIIIYSIAAPSAKEDNDYLKRMGWSGDIKNPKGNFLAVVDSVIDNNQKYVDSLKKTIKHYSEIQSDGRIVNTLTLNYNHSLKSKLKFKEENEKVILENFLRIFVPTGSELLEANIPEQEVYFPPIDYYAAGFRTDNDVAEMEHNLITDASGVQIFQEGDKTVFGFWAPVPLGGNITVSIKYRLPLRIFAENDFYSFFIQKQPGDYSDFESILVFPKNLKPTGQSKENLQVFNGLVKLLGQLNKDKYYEVRFAR